MAIFTLPTKIVVKSYNHKEQGHVSFKTRADDLAKFTVILGGESNVFNRAVSIGVYKASINNYVHISFYFTDRYWQKDADRFLVSGSEVYVMDTSDPACTLFEPIKVDDNGTFYLTHVQSGGRVVLDEATMAFRVELNPNPSSSDGYLSFMDLGALLKLPSHFTFLGGNGRYLKAFSHDKNYLQFASVGGAEANVGHTVTQLPDGHVRIKSDHFGKFWKRSSTASLAWIYAESTDTDTDTNSLFWPIKIDEENNIVALRNEGNGKFAKRFTAGGLTDCLSAATATIEYEAKLRVKELVADRKISGVVYQLQYARIYDATPETAGCTTVTNEGDVEASVDFEIRYQETRWYTIGRTTYTVGAEVPTTMEAGVPFVKTAAGEVAVGDVITFPRLKWHRREPFLSWITVRGAVTVPAKSRGVVSYEGTTVTCKVPFYYHQRDKSSIDEKIIESDQFDGFYIGINSYDFKFVLGTTQPLSD